MKAAWRWLEWLVLPHRAWARRKRYKQMRADMLAAHVKAIRSCEWRLWDGYDHSHLNEMPESPA